MRRSIPSLNVIGQVDLLNNPDCLLLIGAHFVCVGLDIVHWEKPDRRLGFQQENLGPTTKYILAYVGTRTSISIRQGLYAQDGDKHWVIQDPGQ